MGVALAVQRDQWAGVNENSFNSAERYAQSMLGPRPTDGNTD